MILFEERILLFKKKKKTLKATGVFFFTLSQFHEIQWEHKRAEVLMPGFTAQVL